MNLVSMPLDAFVYCDCLETNNLRCDPPGDVQVRVEPCGDLTCDAHHDQQWSAFMAWKRTKACLHYGMILLRHRLGSTEQIDLLRTALQQHNPPLPILQEKVLYSPTHTCDWIPSDLIPQLADEVKLLKPESFQGGVANAVQLFKIRMAELVIAAQHTGKPICF